MTSIEHKGSKLSVDVSADGIAKDWNIDDPYHEVVTEIKRGAKRVHVASLFARGQGPWQFHVHDSINPKKQNSFRDLAIARQAAGNYGAELADEGVHTLVQAKQHRIDRVKALAKSRGSTKRKRHLDF